VVALVIRDHVAAVVALVDADPNVTVYDGQVPNEPTLPYVVIRTDTGRRERSALPATSDRLTLRIWATSVGLNRTSAQVVSERVTAALLDVRPTVSSRSCFPITSVNSQPARVDDVNTSLVYALDEFELVSIPA
jgi:hypothetical protein